MTNASEIRQVPATQLKAELDDGRELFILDLRNPDEFARWQVGGKEPVPTLNIPYFNFLEDEEGNIARLPRDREITLLCAKGGASEYVASLLQERGIAARNVAGGMQAWAVLYAAKPVVEAESFTLLQFDRVAKGCLSYLLASGGEALVVDPGRHVEQYIAAAAARGLTVAGVVDTHVHADHISGGADLAARAGCPYYIADGDMLGAPLAHIELKDGARLRVGDTVVEVLAISTPGHTPGSSSLLVDDRYLLSGDTVFVESVGRPDLGGQATQWARDLFGTLYARLGAVKDDVLVLPAHYSSPTEIRAGGLIAERLGRIRADNAAFHLGDEAAFVAQILADLPVQPAAYDTMRLVNRGEYPVDEDQAFELEIGANQCAAKHHGS
ncbi:MAG TPA: MBL fold metallo-hydrolase [Symbiobacteriaceae bacterium]|jgi:glyoxylase-like metal-dependent hydrolase (beta-lactamase superfamily II)